jgi:cytochrome c oxidase cbb3-type subunit III
LRLTRAVTCVSLACISFGIYLSVASRVHAQEPQEEAPLQPAPAGRSARQGAAAAPQRNRPTFPQQQRQLAAPEVIARGKALYGVNCVACHGSDLRGGDMGGPNLLRSQDALSDKHGEMIGPIIHGARQDKGMPAFNLEDNDVVAVAEYIHSVLAQIGVQGRPPGSETIPELKVIVGDAAAGKTYFDASCASCHSVSGDLHGFAAKYKDPRDLQNAWIGAGVLAARGGPPGLETSDRSAKVTVTTANGQKLEGTLIEQNEFVVTFTTADGVRHSLTRTNFVPKVEVQEWNDAHKKMMLTLKDKDMHDVTAYLATTK